MIMDIGLSDTYKHTGRDTHTLFGQTAVYHADSLDTRTHSAFPTPAPSWSVCLVGMFLSVFHPSL